MPNEKTRAEIEQDDFHQRVDEAIGDDDKPKKKGKLTKKGFKKLPEGFITIKKEKKVVDATDKKFQSPKEDQKKHDVTSKNFKKSRMEDVIRERKK